jgi:hypothetical protein
MHETDMNDHDLAALLRSADRPRTLRDDEAARILQRLKDKDTTFVPVEDDDVDITQHPSTTRLPRDRSRIGRLVSVAAATILVMVGGVALLLPRREPETLPPATVPSLTMPTVDEAAEAFCRMHIDAIAEALERWRGIDNWAWSQATPDLGELTGSALVALSEIETERGLDGGPTRNAANELNDQLEAADEERGSALGNRSFAQTRIDAAESALSTLVDHTRRVDELGRCDLKRLTEQLP